MNFDHRWGNVSLLHRLAWKLHQINADRIGNWYRLVSTGIGCHERSANCTLIRVLNKTWPRQDEKLEDWKLEKDAVCHRFYSICRVNTSPRKPLTDLASPKYRRADKSLVRPRRKKARKHVRDARDFNNIEMRAVIKFLFLQGKAQKEIHSNLTQTLACCLPGRAKDLSAPL